MTESPHISKETFIEILRNEKIIQQDDLLIFQTIYSLDKQEASATDLAKIIGWSDRAAVVGRIVGLGMRILKVYDIKQREREDGTKEFWDFFFTGYHRGTFFIYKLKPELSEALEECNLVDSIKSIPVQNTYLFAWNPNNWNWVDLEKNIEELLHSGKVTLKWSCISHKNIRIGDRAFLVRLGSDPKGIMASGYVVSNPFLSPHWGDKNKDVHRVFIEFDTILNPNNEPILSLDLLKVGKTAKQQWTPQSSGISIQSDCIDELEALWFDFITTHNQKTFSLEILSPTLKTFEEGTVSQITLTRYERNPHARKACLKHYGFSCFVCGFSFEDKYGKLGANFIHVHHLTQVATIGRSYAINPIDDLRPVCPNCHSMLHKKNPPITIEELQGILK